MTVINLQNYGTANKEKLVHYKSFWDRCPSFSRYSSRSGLSAGVEKVAELLVQIYNNSIK